jgi:hypothetical protein
MSLRGHQGKPRATDASHPDARTQSRHVADGSWWRIPSTARDDSASLEQAREPWSDEDMQG